MQAIRPHVSPRPAPRPLSLALREGTRTAHRAAEGAAFLQGLLRGIVDPEAYTRLLHGLLHVYTALERALERHRGHPVMGLFWLPPVFRANALVEDLEYYDPGGTLRARAARSLATHRYVARIEQLDREAPAQLVAHAYTRYLGDLSGGRVLRALVRRVLRPAEGRGLAFFSYPELDDVAAFKRDFRARLDAVSDDPEVVDALVVEANLAFAHNLALFRELEGSALRTLVALARGAFTRGSP